MTSSLIALCLWVLASGLVAMLPMRLQFVPGLALLAAIGPLLVWVGVDSGAWYALAGLFALLSMYRRPLRYLILRALGRAGQ